MSVTIIRLSAHQERVLAALLALERHHRWSWWSRDAIGHVIAAGGFHNVIQRKTISILKRYGLVQTERSSWTPATRKAVLCYCACCEWGLTGPGRKVALALHVRWNEESVSRVRHSLCPGRWPLDDEDDRMRGFDGGDDDEDDDEDGGGSPGPVLSPCPA